MGEGEGGIHTGECVCVCVCVWVCLGGMYMYTVHVYVPPHNCMHSNYIVHVLHQRPAWEGIWYSTQVAGTCMSAIQLTRESFDRCKVAR